jgi:flagellar hook-associated protein 2
VNLDVQGLVSKLVAADRAKDDARISRRETALTVQLSGVSSLKGALSTFQSSLAALKTMSNFSARAASLSSPDYFTATATSSAAPGSYEVEVVALAKSHQIASDPIAGGMLTTVGTGTLTLTVNGTSHNIEITEPNNNLKSVWEQINAISAQTGVQATVINGADGTRLVLTSNATGEDHAIELIASGGDGGLEQFEFDPDGTMNMEELRPAQDAHVIIAGTDVYSSTNSVTGAISGLTLNLKAAVTTPGTKVTLNITNDTAAVQKNVEAFVTAFNKLQESFASLRAVDPTKKTTGPLFGDAMLRGVEDQMRSMLSGTVSGITGDYNSLASIGITRKLDGKLELNSSKLTAALNAGENVVANVFASDNGVAARLSKYVDSQLATGATFDYRNTSIQAGLKDVAKQKEALEIRMASVQARYLKQFTALDSLLTNMQQTSNYLSKQLANLPGAQS